MRKYDSCYHTEACKRQAELSGRDEPKCRLCECYEPDLSAEFPVEALTAMAKQAKAGADYFKDNHCAFVWFSRVYILADELRAKLTGTELSEFTLSNPVYLKVL